MVPQQPQACAQVLGELAAWVDAYRQLERRRTLGMIVLQP
jgi:hypothetical protein